MECHTTLERVVAQRKMHNGLGFQPERGEQKNLVDTVIGVGESVTKKLSVGLNKST